MTQLTFETLNLSAEILASVKSMGFEKLSPIQLEAIPLMQQGKDIIGQAETGTGKTAAFAIPIIEKIDPENNNLQAIILCPTRELAIQISEEFRKLLKYKPSLSVTPVYGGQQIEKQLRALRRGTHIIIGTPGRTMDHMRRGTLDISSVHTVVLDEADEMLDMGFREDIEIILKDTPKDRQTVMFSATMPKDIITLTRKYQNMPVLVNVAEQKLNTPKIEQFSLEVQEKYKPEVLSRLIDLHNVRRALVFCNTKSQVDDLVEILKSRDYFADALHGDMNQNQRDKVMNGFRKGIVEILIATDVAGRGIDVNDIEAIFNYDLPRDDEDYIHRIGRTGRAGKTGMAFTFVSRKQINHLKRIERANGVRISRHEIPTRNELEQSRINSYISNINKIISTEDLDKYITRISNIMGEENTSLEVAAALLKIVIEKENVGFDFSVDFNTAHEDFEDKPSHKRKFADRSTFNKPYKKGHNQRQYSKRKSDKSKRSNLNRAY